MERELWAELSQAISDVSRSRCSGARFTHQTALVVRVYLFAAMHDKSVNWACEPSHWPRELRPQKLPSQSTMSRRLRTDQVKDFLDALESRLSADSHARSMQLIKVIDGLPLRVAAHSQDKQATWGRGAGQMMRGYKLTAILSDSAMPVAWSVQPMNVCEKHVARQLIPQMGQAGGGYLLGDAMFDASDLHDLAARTNHQLVAPRERPGSGLGHRRHSAHRLRSIALLEGDGYTHNPFGRRLYNYRKHIERRYGNLTSFSAGLKGLPAWVRGLCRVRLWVHAKLLINAARIRARDRKVVA